MEAKITTKEQLNGFISEVVSEVMNEKFEDLAKQNQELIAATLRESIVERA